MPSHADPRLPLPMRPQGVVGRLFGLVMERLNAPAYRRVLELVAPRDGDHLLEIGFGTGRLVELLVTAAPGVRVAGVDPTPTMLEVARARRAVRAAGARVDLRLGGDVPLPWPARHFDGAAALHCFQFWLDPERSLAELRRVLKPGGRVVLVLRDHSRRPPAWLPNPLSRGGREVDAARELLSAAGFADAAELVPIGGSRVLSGTLGGR